MGPEFRLATHAPSGEHANRNSGPKVAVAPSGREKSCPNLA
jgi:hypothetical protein